MYRTFLLTLVALFMVSLAVETADAARRWRRSRTVRSTPTNTYQAWQRARRPSTGSLRNWSGVSRSEYDYFRRLDAWHDHAFNGFKPQDFR